MKRFLAALLITSLSAWSVLASASQVEAAAQAERSDDLAQLLDWVALEQSFTDAKRAQAVAIISEHRDQETPFSDAEFYMEVRRIVALADNGHSNVSSRPVHDEFGLVPLRAYWFSDGLYVVRARSDYERLLGARIEAVGETSIDQLEKRLKAFHGGTSNFFRRYTAPALVLSPPLLHAIGLSKSPKQLQLTVVDSQGEREQLTIDVDHDSSSLRARPWRLLNPVPLPGERGWSTVLDAGAELPLHLQSEGEPFRYVPIGDGEFAYIQLRGNMNSDGVSIEAFAKKAQKRLESEFPHSIILDNRQNGGGNLTLTANFALALPSLAYDEGKVYVITEGGTFSAGIYTSFYPKFADAERTVIVGEPVGDRTRFWAETGNSFRLEKSGYGIGYALQVHDVGVGCEDAEVCHMMNYGEEWNLAVGELDPDWPVAYDFADFAAGRDPALDRIREQAFADD